MQTKTLFSKYADVIKKIPTEKLVGNHFPEDLLIERQGNFATWYSPFDFVNVNAKIVIVGITPGYQQATNALIKTKDLLLAGNSEDQVIKDAKIFASFSGPMRRNLVDMLDHIGINNVLDIDTTQSLFAERSELAQFTSTLRYPVMLDEKNYSGSPSMVKTPFLTSQLEKWFGSECEILQDAIYVPLGPKVTEALNYLAGTGIINKSKILDGLPHPSGANSERISFFLGKKKKEHLSSRTNGDKINQAKECLLEKVLTLR